MKYENIVKKLIPHPPNFIYYSEDKYPYYVRAITTRTKYNTPLVNIILCKTLRKANVYVKRMQKFNSFVNDSSFHGYITTGLTENLTVPTDPFYAKFDSYHEDDYWARVFKAMKHSSKR